MSVRRANRGFTVTIDGRTLEVDAVRVDAHVWSLLIEEEGRRNVVSHEVSITPQPASDRLAIHVGSTPVTASLNGRRHWGRKDGSGQAGSGPQQIVASMTGKVVRVLVELGQAVRARQPLVVIEAMKMENELRAAHDGTVADINVRDGQAVEAGALLIKIV